MAYLELKSQELVGSRKFFNSTMTPRNLLHTYKRRYLWFLGWKLFVSLNHTFLAIVKGIIFNTKFLNAIHKNDKSHKNHKNVKNRFFRSTDFFRIEYSV